MSPPPQVPVGVPRGDASGETVLLADVGNSRIKLATAVPAATEDTLPQLGQRLTLPTTAIDATALSAWLQAVSSGVVTFLVASVHQEAASQLEDHVARWAHVTQQPLRPRRVVAADLPLVIALPEPTQVGIDRLAAAAAALRQRRGGQPLVVVDCGTAVTVDLLSESGAFLGGAILPGADLMAKALAAGTSKLPQLSQAEMSPPPPLPGRSTAEAIAAGVGWGLQGAVARVVQEAAAAVQGEVDVLLTGGAAAALRTGLPEAVELPDLVLQGIALAAGKAASC